MLTSEDLKKRGAPQEMLDRAAQRECLTVATIECAMCHATTPYETADVNDEWHEDALCCPECQKKTYCTHPYCEDEEMYGPSELKEVDDAYYCPSCAESFMVTCVECDQTTWRTSAYSLDVSSHRHYRGRSTLSEVHICEWCKEECDECGTLLFDHGGLHAAQWEASAPHETHDHLCMECGNAHDEQEEYEEEWE